MSKLKEKLAQKFEADRKDIAAFVKANGNKEVSKVTLAQAYGGLRGVKGLACDTSEVPPDKGLHIRGTYIGELSDRLPEEILWLLLTAELPSQDELDELKEEFTKREQVPDYVWSVIDSMPADSHPMAMFNTGILCMQHDSVFAKRYAEGMKKTDYWEPTLEDALNIIAKLTALGAYVYRKRFNKGPRIDPKPENDWGKNFVHMIGLEDPNEELTKLMRLYFTLHSDHEGGNVSAFSAATVNSALSDLYYALSAGLNGLAGPLHGLANQECLGWVLKVVDQFNGVPSHEQIEKYTWDTLNEGKVIPGYGHAVLRVTDPRYTAFLEFGKQHCMDSEVFKTVARVYEVVPEVLKQVEKIKNPYPNVDAGSGSLLYYYGMEEFSYYTVLFSISRALGICSQAVVARAMGYPITRPKSLPTNKFKELVGAS